MIQSQPIKHFLDLLSDMPDIEAVDEIDTRLQRIIDDRKAIGNAKNRNDEREALNLEEDQLRLYRHKVIFRIEQRKWSKAVRAVFGEEGFEQCMEWMRALHQDEPQSVPIRRSNLKARHSA